MFSGIMKHIFRFGKLANLARRLLKLDGQLSLVTDLMSKSDSKRSFQVRSSSVTKPLLASCQTKEDKCDWICHKSVVSQSINL